jgi:hypothetical protein
MEVMYLNVDLWTAKLNSHVATREELKNGDERGQAA